MSRKYLAQEERHCSIIDMRHIVVASPPLRRMTADYIRDNSEALTQWRAGTVFVMASSFSRGLAAAIMWLQRPPYPWTAKSTVEQAFEWCEEKLKA